MTEEITTGKVRCWINRGTNSLDLQLWCREVEGALFQLRDTQRMLLRRLSELEAEE